MIHLSEPDKYIFKNILEKYSTQFEFFIFGSRVTGNHHKYSDLDLLVKMTSETPISKLKDEFEDSDITIIIDIHDYDAVSDSFKQLITNSLVKWCGQFE